MRITTKGQVTIPRAIREKYGFAPHTEVEFVDAGDAVVLRKAEPDADAFRQWLEQVRGITAGRMTTDQVMELTRGQTNDPR